ncbi:calcium-dependent phosphotriesterase [Thozetella sp. PMI_491]|nr:calcium-dependent phosphotriesterase [Thozetella sp. PMI_491]
MKTSVSSWSRWSYIISSIVRLVPSAEAAPASTQSLGATPGLLVGPSIVEVSPRLRNIFPAINFNRNVTVPWWETEVLDGQPSHDASLLSSLLRNASIIVLDEDMYELLGVSSYSKEKHVEEIFQFPPAPSFASRLVHDATVYSPECNCIFFAELHPPMNGFSTDAMPWVWRVNLNATSPVTEKVYPMPQLTVANGAYYHNGSTEMVLNNFFGHRFNSPNDVVITRGGVAYFTDGYYGYDNFNDTLKPELPNGVYRWDMATADLRMAAGAASGIFTNPNGVALDMGENNLYVTNRGNTSDNPAGGRTIYQFHLHGTGIPVTGGEVFSFSDSGFPDGVKVDAAGRVYAGVTGGVQVYDAAGKQLGLIKVRDGDVAVNMQWVDDWLYIAARDSLYRVRLACRGVQEYH